MQIRSLVRGGIVAAVTAAAFAVPAAPASAAAAELCPGYITFERIELPGYVNCVVDAAGNYIIRVGDCVYHYDPLFSPFPSQVVPETLTFVDCL